MEDKNDYLEDIVVSSPAYRLDKREIDLIYLKFDNLENQEKAEVKEVFTSLCYDRGYCCSRGVDYESLSSLDNPDKFKEVVVDAYRLYSSRKEKLT